MNSGADSNAWHHKSSSSDASATMFPDASERIVVVVSNVRVHVKCPKARRRFEEHPRGEETCHDDEEDTLPHRRLRNCLDCSKFSYHKFGYAKSCMNKMKFDNFLYEK